jgi:hypothetical protein
MDGMHGRINTALVMMIPLLTNYIADAQTANPPGADSNLACVERLNMPRYPRLAAQARVEASIMASVLVGSDGLAKKIDTSKDAKFSNLFAAPVSAVIQAAKFRTECAGKTVQLIFNFNLIGVSQGTQKETFSFGYPNVFWIVSEAPHLQP